MRASVLAEIIQQVDGLEMDGEAKRQVKDIIQRAATIEGVTAVDRLARIDFAMTLLNLRVSRTTIKNRLVARYGISSRQAYRIIDAALNCDKNRGQMAEGNRLMIGR